MTTDQIFEGIGYLGSVMVVVSLAMGNVRRLRRFNLSGALLFAVYGVYFTIYPIIVANFIIAAFNIYHLWRLKISMDLYQLAPVTATTSVFLPQFLNYHKIDIRKHFPEFRVADAMSWRHIFVIRNAVPVGIFSYMLEPDGSIYIHLDYVIPDYRDYRTASYFFEEFGNLMSTKGYHIYVTHCDQPVHERYL